MVVNLNNLSLSPYVDIHDGTSSLHTIVRAPNVPWGATVRVSTKKRQECANETRVTSIGISSVAHVPPAVDSIYSTDVLKIDAGQTINC